MKIIVALSLGLLLGIAAAPFARKPVSAAQFYPGPIHVTKVQPVLSTTDAEIPGRFAGMSCAYNSHLDRPECYIASE